MAVDLELAPKTKRPAGEACCEPVVYPGHQTLSPVFVPRHLHDELTQRDRIQAALNRDYTLVLGVVICYAALIIALNFVADILYGLLDPRVRLR